MRSRTYRHLPWLIWSAVLMLILAAMGYPLVADVLQTPSVASVAKAFVVLTPITLLATFLVLYAIRVRTVIDDVAVTQHWITSSYRIPFHEITRFEREQSSLYRWFVRAHCAERTFEVIPCQLMSSAGGPFSPQPPRAMLAVEAALEARVGKQLDAGTGV